MAGVQISGTPQEGAEKAEMTETVLKPKKRRRLKVAHPERCIGCLSCMFACSRVNTGTASLQDSAIKIQTRGVSRVTFVSWSAGAARRLPVFVPAPQEPWSRKLTGVLSFTRSCVPVAANAKRPALSGL